MTDLEPIKQQFTDLVGKDTWQKESSFALQIFKKNPKLIDCDPQSLLDSVLNVAQIGLTLNPALKLAYLLPRYDSGSRTTVCCLEPSYQGLVKLVTDTGSVKSLSAYLVYDGDEFEVTLGTNREIIHKPKYTSKEVTHVYAVADLFGELQVEVMTRAEINDIANRSESVKAMKAGKIKSCVWKTDFGEMARKTVIRRIVKYLPKSDKWEKVNKAIELQELDFKPSDGAIEMATQLIWSANLSPERQEAMTIELQTAPASRVHEMIEQLKEDQVDPINSGFNYSQTDIKNKLKEI